VGGFFVVEDGIVDVPELRSRADWPRGVLPAVRDWLDEGAEAAWTVRTDLQLYGITCHPGGFLQRVRAR
jgi:cephalosporin hydroxylase